VEVYICFFFPVGVLYEPAIMLSTPKKTKIPQYRPTPRTPTTKEIQKSCGTPLKLSLSQCVVCGKSGISRYTLLHSSAGIKKGLSPLLYKYGGVNITQGMICTTDQEKLINLETKVRSFHEQCQANIKTVSRSGGVKRCSITPSKAPSKSSEKRIIVEHPQEQKTSKKQLFQTPVQGPSQPQGIIIFPNSNNEQNLIFAERVCSGEI
jgi:hypothetical protein